MNSRSTVCGDTRARYNHWAYIGHVDLSQNLKSDRYMQQNKQVSIPHKVSQPEHALETGQKRVDANGQSTEQKQLKLVQRYKPRQWLLKKINHQYH